MANTGPRPKPPAPGGNPSPCEPDLSAEEVALLEKRLATADQAVTSDELLAMLDDDLKAEGGGR